MSLHVVLIHGWSVTSTETYGLLPSRLKEYAAEKGRDIEIHDIRLGKYISFRDEVCLDDIACAMQAALKDAFKNNGVIPRFACITHSTGGPLARLWKKRFYPDSGCPMSHLIMLAPANFGSALAQLGKSTISKMKYMFFDGVDCGEGVLNWLELGSQESLDLNIDYVLNGKKPAKRNPVYQFVLTGQCIDRKLYDVVNSYTGELGSDGVVRVAAANLNCSYLKLSQKKMTPSPQTVFNKNRSIYSGDLREMCHREAPKTAFAIVPGCSHSGEEMGIMCALGGKGKEEETLKYIFECLQIKTPEEYEKICKLFEERNDKVQKTEEVEIIKSWFNKTKIRDKFSMIILRVMDDHGKPVMDFDFSLFGPDENPNLPSDFVIDRQKNKRFANILSLYLNTANITGTPSISDIRPALKRIPSLGFKFIPHQLDGFVHYGISTFEIPVEELNKYIKPNQTLIVDLVVKRIIHKTTMRLTNEEETQSALNALKNLQDKKDEKAARAVLSFKDTKPGDKTID